MVFRPDTILARLLRLESVIHGLVKLSALDRKTLLEDETELWSIERGLQLGAEILFDVGNHILTAYWGRSSDRHEDILDNLEQAGVIGHELRERLHGLGGFRNLLVHDYLRINRERVLDLHARAPRDFGDFSRAIRKWLKENHP